MGNTEQTQPAPRKYLVKFTKFDASALFEYSPEGYLIAYTLETGSFGQEQLEFIKTKFPRHIKQMQAWISWKLPNTKISEVPQDLSFDVFYNAYAHKVSKRKTAETIWNKMPDTQKAKALAYIPTYDRYLRESKVNKKYPETYLNSEMWNN